MTLEQATFWPPSFDPRPVTSYMANIVYVFDPVTETIVEQWWAFTVKRFSDTSPFNGTVRMVAQADGTLLLLTVIAREGQNGQYDLLTQTFDVAGNTIGSQQNLGVTATSQFVEIELFDGGLVIVYQAADGMRLTGIGLPTDPEPYTAPTILNTASPQQVTVGGALNLALALLFTDADGDDLSFSVLGLLAGLRLNAETGQISGQVAEGVAAGSYVLTLRAHDDDGQFVEQSLTLIVAGAPVPTSGNDRLIGQDTPETIFALAGDDTVSAGGGNDSVFAGDGNDRLFGGDGEDILYGGTGNDLLNGDTGNNTLVGGAGNDTYVVNTASDRVFETTTTASQIDAGGIDTVRSAVSLNLNASAGVRFVERLALTGTANINATGNALANVLTGNAGNNVLNGGLGNDTLVGGAGNDTYFVNAAGDRVFETTTTASLIDAGGIDTVRSEVSLNLNASAGVRFVERLTLTGTANINATGNALANLLTGNAGNNVLNGGLGNDTLVGGAGNDTFVFSAALGATNIDQITNFSLTDDTICLDDAVFAGLASGRLDTSAFAANLTGRAADALDRVIYEVGTGRIYFDADGNGAGSRIHFATLTANLALTNADFIVF